LGGACNFIGYFGLNTLDVARRDQNRKELRHALRFAMVNRALLNPQAADHLVQLLGYLGSNHDGERAAAAFKAHEIVRRLGLKWSDVIYSPPGELVGQGASLRPAQQMLSERERDFPNNISKLRRPLSDKRLAWLGNIYSRLHGHGREAAA
jgi:hypothetical protein